MNCKVCKRLIIKGKRAISGCISCDLARMDANLTRLAVKYVKKYSFLDNPNWKREGF